MAREIDIWRGSSPVRDFANMTRKLNRLFEDPRFDLDIFPDFSQDLVSAGMDMDETEDLYLLSLDVPGIPKDKLNIELTGNRLMVWGERETREKGTKGRISRREYNRFEQTFILPADIDASKVEAEYQDGVLRLAIPKSEQSKARRIEIGPTKEGGILSKLMGKVQEAVGSGEKKEAAAAEKKAEKAA